MITKLAISGYRSLRDIHLNLEQVNIVTGANGSGKSSLFKALKLLTEVSRGQLFSSLAKEGGFPSTLWAGPENFSRAMRIGEEAIQGTRRKGPVALKLGFASESYSYLIDLGLPTPSDSAFGHDPEIKQEIVWHGEVFRPSTIIAKRTGKLVSLKNSETNSWTNTHTELASFDSMMTHGTDPQLAPELLILRDEMREWRFYDHFRTDENAAARQGQIGTRTPILSPDGYDLAAAIQTIREIGDRDSLSAAIEDAFPGASLSVEISEGRFYLYMRQYGLLRKLSAKELSDGTLRYILLVAALLSPRPPKFLVLNEPETSLHQDLLAPLARLIARASEESQILVVSHSDLLIDYLTTEIGCQLIRLEKDLSETEIPLENQSRWTWPKR
ncbi:AAA family ATPase [Hellea balneolensis]|uniref:AAA family ATPase n=1 Tax=Hellea balneolensis TaxID=287478 RepID=UPI000421EB51|nr:AAA family ATPase [Hellea balneolensis]